jgi:hypothetical protein
MESSVTIPAGEVVSTPLDLTSQAVTMVIAPAEWTAANLSFLISIDGVNFFDLVDAASGVEIARAIQPSSAVKVDESYTRYVNYLKVRSGPRDNPIAQEADRVLTLVTTRV